MLDINKIYFEDCLEGMKRIDDKSIDMILCDLPYGTTECEWDLIIPFDKLWEQYERIIKDCGVMCLFSSQPFTSKLVMSNLKLFKYCWYYRKSRGANWVLSGYQPLKIIEEVCVFSKSASTYTKNNKNMNYYPQLRTEFKTYKRSIHNKEQESIKPRFKNHEEFLKTSSETTSGLNPVNLLYDYVDKDERIHPTQKPISLCEYLIKTYTNENELVLDNCMGSGTTAIACLNTKRNFIGFETNEEYFQKACERIKNHEIKLKPAKSLEKFLIKE